MNLPPRLLAAIADSGVKVRFGYPWWLRMFLMRDVVAITLGKRIYLRQQMAENALERLMNHELAHVRQIDRLGLWVFLWRYVSEFVRHWARLRSIGAAYTCISFEVEARAAEDADTL
jgi:hypothetical protein